MTSLTYCVLHTSFAKLVHHLTKNLGLKQQLRGNLLYFLPLVMATLYVIYKVMLKKHEGILKTNINYIIMVNLFN